MSNTNSALKSTPTLHDGDDEGIEPAARGCLRGILLAIIIWAIIITCFML